MVNSQESESASQTSTSDSGEEDSSSQSTSNSSETAATSESTSTTTTSATATTSTTATTASTDQSSSSQTSSETSSTYTTTTATTTTTTGSSICDASVVSSIAPTASGQPSPDLSDARAWEALFLSRLQILSCPAMSSAPPQPESSLPLAVTIVSATNISPPVACQGQLFRATLSLFHTQTRSFIGRTYTSPACVASADTSEHSNTNATLTLLFGHTTFVHTPITGDSTVLVVVELQSATDEAGEGTHGEGQESLGWTFFPLTLSQFRSALSTATPGSKTDASSKKKGSNSIASPPITRPLFSGSPRMLMWLPDPMGDFLTHLVLNGAVKIGLEPLSPSAYSPLLHFLPPHVFVGENERIPGIRGALEHGGSKLKLDAPFPLSVTGIQISYPITLEKELLDRFASTPSRGSSSTPLSRKGALSWRLRFLVHTTYRSIGEPIDLRLRSLPSSSAGRDEDSGAMRLFGFQGTLSFPFLRDSLCALICELLCVVRVGSKNHGALASAEKTATGEALITEESADDEEKVTVVVGKSIFLPCVDDHIPNGGTRVVQAYMLSGPHFSTDLEPIYTSRTPSSTEYPLLPFNSSPFYVTFTAQGHTLPSPHGATVAVIPISERKAALRKQDASLLMAPVHYPNMPHTPDKEQRARKPGKSSTPTTSASTATHTADATASGSRTTESETTSSERKRKHKDHHHRPKEDRATKKEGDQKKMNEPVSAMTIEPSAVAGLGRNQQPLHSSTPGPALATSPLIAPTVTMPSFAHPQSGPLMLSHADRAHLASVAFSPVYDHHQNIIPAAPMGVAAVSSPPANFPPQQGSEQPVVTGCPPRFFGSNVLFQFQAIALIPSAAASRSFSHSGGSAVAARATTESGNAPPNRLILAFHFYDFPLARIHANLISPVQQDSILDVSNTPSSPKKEHDQPPLPQHLLVLHPNVIEQGSDRHNASSAPGGAAGCEAWFKHNFCNSSGGAESVCTATGIEEQLQEFTAFSQYLSHSRVVVEMIDGDSLFTIGKAFIPLRHLIRPVEQAYSTFTQEFSVIDSLEHHLDYHHHHRRAAAMPQVLQPPGIDHHCLVNGFPNDLAHKWRVVGKIVLRMVNIGTSPPCNPSLQTEVQQHNSNRRAHSLGPALSSSVVCSSGQRTVKAEKLIDHYPHLRSLLSFEPLQQRLNAVDMIRALTNEQKEDVKRLGRLMAVKRHLRQNKEADSSSKAASGPRLLGYRDPVEAIKQDGTISTIEEMALRLETLDVFRYRYRQMAIEQKLRTSIAEQHQITVRVGSTTLFELSFRNPFPVDQCFRISIEPSSAQSHPHHEASSSSMTMVSSLAEWQQLSKASHSLNPFPLDSPPTFPTVFVAAHQQLLLPFKIKSSSWNPQNEAGCTLSFTITVCPQVAMTASKDSDSLAIQPTPPVRVCHLVVHLRPPIISQDIRLYCAEDQPIVRRLPLVPLRGLPSTADVGASWETMASSWNRSLVSGSQSNFRGAAPSLSVISSHPRAKAFALTQWAAESAGEPAANNTQSGIPLDYVQFEFPAVSSAESIALLLFLYDDVFLNDLREVWQVQLVACRQYHASLPIGQTTTFNVSIPTAALHEAAAEPWECVASHPNLVITERCTTQGDVKLRHTPPWFTPTDSVYFVNLVSGKASRRSLATIIVDIETTLPPSSRVWSEKIAPLLPSPSAHIIRRIPFTNLYLSSRVFYAFTSDPNFVRLHPPLFRLEPSEKQLLTLTMANLTEVGRTYTFHVFVNTDDDLTEECLMLSITVA